MSPTDYVGLHQRYASLLEGQPLDFIAGRKEEEDKLRAELSRLFDGMMETLYKQEGANLNITILETPKTQEFIEAHAGALDSSFKQVEMSDLMRRRLERSNYIFSGMKTFHELNEAFPSLLDENGNRKPFEQFLNDVRKVDDTYNGNYLRAEYNFIQASAQMAGKWERFMKDGDRYNLQYRTVCDDKVRPEHAALHGVTLPISDSFWEEFYPPNGWGCRCTVVQVRKSKYAVTDHEEAMSLGELATGKDTKGIFRFNPGKQEKAMPDYNPYTIRRCKDCDIAKGKLKLAFIPDNELCAACEILQKCVGDRTKSERAIERTHYLHEMEPLLHRKVQKLLNNGQTIKVSFDNKGNKHLYSDVISRTRRLQLDDLKNLGDILEQAIYAGEAAREPGHSNPYEYFYYFKAEVNGQTIRINVGKKVQIKSNGQISVKYICYSVNNI